MDPIKEIITQGATQVGTLNTQLVSGMTMMMTQLAANMDTAALTLAAAAPDLSTLAPAGMPMLPQMPSMGGVPMGVPMGVPAGVPAATPAPVTTTRYGARMIV